MAYSRYFFLSQKSTQKDKVKRSFIRTGQTPGSAFYQPSAQSHGSANSAHFVMLTTGSISHIGYYATINAQPLITDKFALGICGSGEEVKALPL